MADSDDHFSGPRKRGPDFDAYFHDLSQTKLEELAISAIREHRRLVAKAASAREASREAAADPAMDLARQDELQRVSMAADMAYRAHQLVLNHLLGRLTYVPNVPPESDAIDAGAEFR